MIRGFATNRLLYSVDGVRMNTAIFRGGNIQNVISLDPFAIENTEVLFGPGSVIYGSDAIGGVMSFTTLTPQFSADDTLLVSGKALTRFASANLEKTGHVDVNLGWKKWATVTSISYNDYDHLKMGSHGPDDYLNPVYVERINGRDSVLSNPDPRVQRPSAYEQYNLMQKVRYAPTKDWDIEYAFHYSATSEYGRYDRHQRTRNGLPRYAVWSYGPQKWMMNQLSIDHTKSNAFYDDVVLRLAQQSFEESRIDRSLNDAELQTRTEQVAAYSINLDFVKALNKKNSVYYGAEYILNDVTSTGMAENIEEGTSYAIASRYPQALWQSAAIYLNHQYRANENITLQTGARYNQFLLDAQFDTTFYNLPFQATSLNKGALTGSFGVVYKPKRSWVISTNLATGFRAPNVDDMGKVFDSEPGAVVVPNPDLKAEYVYNADLGIAKVFNEVLKIDATGYYTILNHALVRRDYSLNGQDSLVYDGVLSEVQAIQNAAIAKVYGFQFGIELKLPSGFGFSSDINYQQGEEELDDGSISPSRHAAPSFGVTRLWYKNKVLHVQLYTMYQAERSFEDLAVSEQGKTEIYALDAKGDPYAPAWYTLNLKALYKINKTLSASAGVENISDQRYRPYSSGISGAGRNVIVSLRANF